MRVRLRTQSSNGIEHFKAGAELTGMDSEWLRRLLVNGLAEPLDDEAKAIAVHPPVVGRYRSLALIQAARDLGVTDDNIPGISVFTG